MFIFVLYQDSVQKWERIVEEPLLRQVYAFIRNHKTTGVTQLQVANAFGITNVCLLFLNNQVLVFQHCYN